MIRPTRFYSNKQEKRVAKEVEGKRQSNSGATLFQKGDVVSDLFLIECKTKTKPSDSMTIKKDWFLKNQEEAFAMNKFYSAIAIDFGDGEDYYIIDKKLFRKLIRLLGEEENL